MKEEEIIPEFSTKKYELKEESLENQISDELEKTEILADSIKKEIESLGGEDSLKNSLEDASKEEKNNIYEKVRKILYISSVLLAIPMVATMSDPSLKSSINEALTNFFNNPVTLSVVGAGALAASIGIIKELGGIKNLFKDFDEKDKHLANEE